MQIQISWLLKKPTDLDLQCLQRQGISGFSRIRIKKESKQVFRIITVNTRFCMIQQIDYNVHHLTHNMLGKISADDKQMIFSIIFPESRI